MTSTDFLDNDATPLGEQAPALVVDEAVGAGEAAESSAERAKESVKGGLTFFREILDEEDAIPTLEQLERFGLFDKSESDRRLGQYRSLHPSPQPTPSSPTVGPASPDSFRPTPNYRHSLSIVPPRTQFLSASASPSPTSPSSSPRLNPFAFVRKATIRPRPSQRAKSTGDVAVQPPAATPTLGERQPFFVDVTSGGAGASTSTSTPRSSFSLSRNETVKENKAPRKLKKALVPRISVRTDDDYLCRPSTSSPHPPAAEEKPLHSSSSSSASRPPPIRLPSWRSSTSSSTHVASSPLSYDYPDLPPRSPSPVDAFPSSIRREAALPSIEGKKRGSTTSSSASASSSTDAYLADNERARFSPRASRTRFGSRPSSPAVGSPTAAGGGGMWSKLRLRKASTSSRPSSIASGDSSSTWELVEGAPSSTSAEQQQQQRGFEVLSRSSPVRPSPERSLSDTNLDLHAAALAGPSLVELALLSSSTSQPNLSRILERSEAGSGTTTPALLSAASSMTCIPAETSLRNSPRHSATLQLASHPSSTSLHRAHTPSPLHPPTAIAAAASNGNDSSFSLASPSWHSSRSSRSRDSLFYSGDDTHAEETEGTGASSAPEEEEEEEEEELRLRKMGAEAVLPLGELSIGEGTGLPVV